MVDLLQPLRSATHFFQQIWLSDNDSAIGYDVTKNDNPNRRPIRRRVYPQDRKLRTHIRERAIATAQDIQQNFAVVAWAIRKHLDYVSDMKFRGDTGDDAIDETLEQFMMDWSSRHNCDVRRRHPLRRIIRLAEMRRLVDGDFFLLKVGGVGPNRGKIQPIEGYRIQNPDNQDGSQEWVNGVQLGVKGQAVRYAVWHRTMNGGLEFDGVIPSPNMIPIGYYERFDQVRGISPLLAGLHEFMDVMDSVTLMKSKLKLQQLFAVALYREPRTPTAVDGLPKATADLQQDGIPESNWQFEFDGLPQQFTGLQNDKLEMIESRQPATESVDFMKFVLSMALKALDLPDSFLKEDTTNFFGSRSALMQYLKSAHSKQADLIDFLNELTRWRIGMAMADGQLELGIPFDEVKWRWVPKGQPWAWDPVKEASGLRMSLEAGLDSFERACMLNGTTPKDNIDEYNKWANYSEQTYGRPLVMSTSSASLANDEGGTDEE